MLPPLVLWHWQETGGTHMYNSQMSIFMGLLLSGMNVNIQSFPLIIPHIAVLGYVLPGSSGSGMITNQPTEDASLIGFFSVNFSTNYSHSPENSSQTNYI